MSQQPELLSAFMQRYAQTTAFREKLLDLTRGVPKVGGWLTPDMVQDLRAILLGRHWQRADHFPAFTMGALNHSVAVATRLAGANHKPLTVEDLLDLGDYVPGKAERVSLDTPATHPTYAEDPADKLTALAPGIVMGDGPDPTLAPMHAERVS